MIARHYQIEMGRQWLLAAGLGLTVALAGGCKPPPAVVPEAFSGKAAGGLQPAAPTQGAPAGTSPGSASPAASAAAAADDLPDDPVELTRLAIEAQQEKIRLIASVQDLESAKAVSGTFPAIAERHRRIEDKLGNRLLSEATKQQLERDFKAQRDRLLADYSKEYVRVAFIPGAWENMHPELTPFADMTIISEDAAGLEQAAVRMLTEALAILRQTTDANKAVELSPRYRVATCRLGPVLSRLSVASGGSGIREVQPPQVQGLRRQWDDAQRQLMRVHGVLSALKEGRVPVAPAATPQISATPAKSDTDRIFTALRSQDRAQIVNTLNPLPDTLPAAEHEAIGLELIRLLDFEPVALNALESIKRGWFSPSQIPQLRGAMPKLRDRNLHYVIAEGISRVPNLDRENIEFLATLFDDNPGVAVSVLRNVGPAVEPIVHPYAASPKVEVRLTVCELLRDIGSEVSLPTLQKLAEDSDRGVASKAQEAIREIGKPKSQRPHLRDRQ